MKEACFEDEPLWYKDAIIYELHVRAFYDTSHDGIGDFRGLTEKLGYLERLGITAIWLLPFYPSPQRDDGYDIADYFNIHHDYGSLKDFKEFLRAAHRLGIRVITELVLNHTSNEHKWFQQARRTKPGSKLREFYVWSDTPDKYKDARVIFSDFESSNWAWDPIAQAYYWHRFYSHQPDLNYDNPHMREAMLRVIDFWFNLGVDGLRLDAVPYLYKREGTNCENLPETHNFLKKIRDHVDKKFKDKMLLAEANQWPEDASAYFSSGDECHMVFHFPLMPRIFMATQLEDSFPIIDILKSTPAIAESCQWGIFLRNHDELTLEMVTDEERDYMYRVYAKDPRAKINLGIRRRLAPLLSNNRRRIELMNIILFSLPGTPIIYYGDEIGMGDNYYLGDRNGVRTPMQWSPDKNAGFSRVNPQQLYLPVIIDPEYHYEAVNAENQEKNLSSLLWWTRRVIAMRKRFKSFGRGSFELLTSNNPKVLAFMRQYQDEKMLVLVNLSRFSQVVELDLPGHAGFVPQEVFGQNKFPIIKNTPYTTMLGPHNHYWLLLQQAREMVSIKEDELSAKLNVRGSWENILNDKQRGKFEGQILANYLRNCRWFKAKAKAIREIKILEDAPINSKPSAPHLLLIAVSYSEGPEEIYLLPISFVAKSEAQTILEEFPQSVITFIRVDDAEGIIYDSTYDEEFHKTLLSLIAQKKRIKGKVGEFLGYSGRGFKKLLAGKELPLGSHPLKAEQSNTSIVYEKNFFLKLYRRLDEGVNPELEITKNLAERMKFPHIPQFAGAIEYRQRTGEPITVALLQEFVENIGDAWNYTLDMARGYFERVLSMRKDLKEFSIEYPSLLDVDITRIPPIMQDLIGGVYLKMSSLLGVRTAELHLALGAPGEDGAFTPEPFSLHYQKSLHQSIQSLVRRTMQSLTKSLEQIPEDIQAEAEEMLANEQRILSSIQPILAGMVRSIKTRIHGNYHLGQVLYQGKDFVIIDFEGESARPLSERKLKHSPLKDVASMIRSFHYAAHGALYLRSSLRPEDIPLLEKWIEPWYHYVSGVFLHTYLNTVGDVPFIPKTRNELEILLQTFLLEKAVYELGYELNNRPERIIIPIRVIKNFLEHSP